MLGKEEYALGMEQRSNYASVTDAKIKPRKEECAEGMGRRSLLNSAAFKVA